ncbi:hypothetical protein L7F22_057539 [Adiantum nelumboides]|nr:hypothetical protein [Adiantum nelumboides]
MIELAEKVELAKVDDVEIAKVDEVESVDESESAKVERACDLSVVGYTDVDYAGDLDKRRSTSGYLYTFVGGVISWFSRLQSCTTLSTIEAVYVAASNACKEAIWLTRLVGDLGIVDEVPVLHCDSQSAIQMARNPVFHAKTKHVDVKYHFTRDVLDDKRLHLSKVHTNDNPADLLTKTLSPEQFVHYRELMGIG